MKLSDFLSIFSLQVFVIGQTVSAESDFLKLVLTREDWRITNVKDISVIKQYYYDESHNTYISMVGLGDTKQNMLVQYSTANDLSWLISKHYDKCDQNYNAMTKLRKFYDPTASLYHHNNGENDATLYVHNKDYRGDKKWAFGTIGGDSLIMEGPHASRNVGLMIDFIEVTWASTNYAAGKMDGVVSLRYDPRNPNDSFAYKVCKSGRNEAYAIFAFWFPRKAMGPANPAEGELMICAVDTTKFVEGTMQFTNDIEPGTWRVRMEAVVITFDGQNIVLQNSPQAIFDSTADRIYGPIEKVEMLHNYLKTKPHPTQPEKRIIDCSRRDALPKLQFRIIGTAHTLLGVDYTWEMWKPEDNSYVCEVLISPAPIDYWILGDIFLRAVYTAFDVTHQMIGFARMKEGPLVTKRTGKLPHHSKSRNKSAQFSSSNGKIRV